MKLYYSHNSGPRVTVAAARHIGAKVEFIRANPTDPTQKAFYAPLNPNRRVPILQEGDRTLWEADAVVCRLCQITGSDFWPAPEDLPDLLRWLSWNAWHFGPAASGLYFEHVVKPTFNGAPAPAALLAQFLKDFRHYAGILNAELEGREWLIRDRLSYADFRVAFVFPYADRCGLPIDEFPELARLNRQLNALPAWRDPFAGLEG
jgi:glutathione S-transferase